MLAPLRFLFGSSVALASLCAAAWGCSATSSASTSDSDAGSDAGDGAPFDVSVPDVVPNDVANDPIPDWSCLKNDAKTPDPTLDGGGCVCPTPIAQHSACDPAIHCAHCQWATCWADCVDAGPAWVAGCTE
jgi:hypothetical protein